MTKYHADSFSKMNAMLSQHGYRDKPYSGLGGGCWTADLNWMERAAVYRIPEDAFKRGYAWQAEAKQITLIEKLEKKLKIKQKKKQALALSRLDGESYLYFDLGQSPSSPLRIDTVTAGKLRFVNVIRRNKLTADTIDADPTSEYYGSPKFYIMQSSGGGQVRIHPSRICRFVYNADPESGNGRSILWLVSDVIRDAINARCNASGLTTEARIWVMKMEGLANQVAEDPESVAKRYSLAKEGMFTNSMLIIDKENEDFAQQSTSFTGITDIIESIRREVAAAIEIPYPLLFGLNSGLGSNGETDLKEYYDNVKVVQEESIDGPCELLDQCVIRSALGSVQDEIFHTWNSLFELTDKEKAELAKSHAETAKIYVEQGIIPADVFTEAAINDLIEIGIFPGIEQAALGLAERVKAENEEVEGDVIGRSDEITVEAE